MIHIHRLSHYVFLEQDTFVSLYIRSSPVSVWISLVVFKWDVFETPQRGCYDYNLVIYHKLSKTYW